MTGPDVVIVDRLWPRGTGRDALAIPDGEKGIGPREEVDAELVSAVTGRT